jgi:DNA-binding PadR family transcriptional regulator
LSVRLFVLGALCEGDAHGYDIIEKGRAWGLESWSGISFSSIYHALRALAREGLAREVSRESDGGRPQRTVYRITQKGRSAFAALMRESSSEVAPARDPIYLVLGLMRLVRPEERARMLESRAASLAELAAAAGEKIRYLEGRADPDRWALESARLYLRKIEAEREWLRALTPED